MKGEGGCREGGEGKTGKERERDDEREITKENQRKIERERMNDIKKRRGVKERRNLHLLIVVKEGGTKERLVPMAWGCGSDLCLSNDDG